MKSLLPFEVEKRKILTKKEAKSAQEYGLDPSKRSIEQLIHEGIINVNKPSGPTSHQVSDHVKKIFKLAKTGHSGTLDPKVTGVLPVALEKSTRIVQALLPAGKEYVAIMRLHQEVNEKDLKEAVKKFTGTIQQLPPVRSAVKRRTRPRTVYYLDILEQEGTNVLLRIGCEAGTYIRKLLHDIGRELKVGAHMLQLVRTKAGPFSDQNWYSLQDIRDAYESYIETKDETALRKIIQPVEKAVSHLKKIWVLDSAIANLCHGAYLGPQGISKLEDNIKAGEKVAVFSLKEELVCLGTAEVSSQEILKQEEGIALRTEKVFMDRTAYPRIKKEE